MQVERTDVQQQQHVRKVGYSLITQPWSQTINSVEDLWLLEGNILISRRKTLHYIASLFLLSRLKQKVSLTLMVIKALTALKIPE